MAGSQLSAAKAVLLAVHSATTADIATLRALISRNQTSLRPEIVLRILLSHLPESLKASEYVPFLQGLMSGELADDPKVSIETAPLNELSQEEAKKRTRKLGLLQLAWPDAPEDAPTDPLVLFIIHRALRIDLNTGLIAQVPELFTPFLSHSPYLRAWVISTFLPMYRLSYEYHPDLAVPMTLRNFHDLSDLNGVKFLLAHTGKDDEGQGVGRDLRGLIGPWMHGDSRWKRRRLFKNSTAALEVDPTGKLPSDYKYAGWEEVFQWVATQAQTSWEIAVKAIEQWDGPGDVDLGGYEDSTVWLDEDDHSHLERRYARAALATAYLISAGSADALFGIHRILVRINSLLDLDKIPTLEAATAILPPIPAFENGILKPQTATHLRNALLDEENLLTSPDQVALSILHALLLSAFLLGQAGDVCSIRKCGELVLLQEDFEQREVFMHTLNKVVNGPKSDDKYWARIRREVLWLRNWGPETSDGPGRGPFGQLPQEFIEAEILKVLLANTRYSLAQSIYNSPTDKPLSETLLRNTIISAAMSAYGNATNANKTRGGLKRADDILRAFPDLLNDSIPAERAKYLIQVTHDLGNYRLVFKQGEPFLPANLKIHPDPLSLIGKIFDQNEKTYTKMSEFINMGRAMVLAGLVSNIDDSNPSLAAIHIKEQTATATRRVVSMCIAAALAEDDFETAYSYVTTRLKDFAGQAQSGALPLDQKTGLALEHHTKDVDDWSWKAALEAGKYKRNHKTVKATHLGNANANLEIRHLEQRIDCLNHALRLAPRSTLQEILNVYRRCEEELETHMQQEAEQEAAWDAQVDKTDMPGGFAVIPGKDPNIRGSSSKAVDESPISLFDLSRESIARAQSGFSAISMFRTQATSREAPETDSLASSQSTLSRDAETADQERIRKRDQLKNAAASGLASGVGWLLGAKPVTDE